VGDVVCLADSVLRRFVLVKGVRCLVVCELFFRRILPGMVRAAFCHFIASSRDALGRYLSVCTFGP
jgi:hypothetical protein